MELLEEKVPREVLLKAIEEISNMTENQLEGLMFIFELFNKYDIDENLFEETTNH